MRRTCSPLVLLLSATLLTFGAAWSCAWWRPAPGGPEQTPSFWKQPDRTTWMGPGRTGVGWTEITLFGASGFTPAGYDLAEWLPGWVSPPTDRPVEERAVLVISAGWPAPCLRARLVGHGDHTPGPGGLRTGLGPQRVHWGEWEQAVVVHESLAGANKHRVLPRGVIASGMVIDLLFWSIPGLTIIGLFLIRRISRRRRSCCPACGYPIGTSDVCSECGAGHHA